MKKLIIKLSMALLLASSFFQSYSAHAQAFNEGNIVVSAGYGFPYLTGALFNAYSTELDYKKTPSFGPIFIKGEYGISEHIGVGLNFAYAQTGFSFTDQGYDVNGNPENYTAKLKYSSLSVLGRLNYHFTTSSDKFDPYIGIGLGYRTGNYSFTDNNPDNPISVSLSTVVPLGFELTLGARYYFSDNIGAYAEVGIAKAPFQIGLVGKFGSK